jgi:L-ascorbate metabolism protein UlaG (beta-lactamase superfamily)
MLPSGQPGGLSRQVVMDAIEAAELTQVLRPRLAVPIHYAITGGPILDRVMLKLDRDRPELYTRVPSRTPTSPAKAARRSCESVFGNCIVSERAAGRAAAEAL